MSSIIYGSLVTQAKLGRKSLPTCFSQYNSSLHLILTQLTKIEEGDLEKVL